MCGTKRRRDPLLALGLSTLVLALSVQAEAGWPSGGWLYRKAITLNGGLVPAAQSNFPVLVSLTADADLAADALDSGDDILFTAADGVTKLDHEIELFDGAGTGALVAWVRVPSLASGSNTTLYMYYGNAGSTNQQSPAGVWGASYDGVWHLGTSLADSTSGGNDGTDQGGSSVAAGTIGSGRTLDGVDDYISTTNAFNNPTTFTLEAWFRTGVASGHKVVGFEDTQTGEGSIWWNRDLYVGTDGKAYFESFPESADSPLTYVDGLWHHMVGVRDGGTTHVLYVDGQPVQSLAGPLAAQDNHIGYWRIGSYKLEFHTNALDGYFAGDVDEVRVSSVARSPQWIETQYNNQANQGVGAGKFILALGLEASQPALNYRSIGTAPARTSPGDGTVSATNGSDVVTGSGTLWRSWNRGRGDVITIDGGDYTVALVSSETELRLTTSYTGTSGAGQSYLLDRQFDNLVDWEDCIDGPGGMACIYFPVAGNDLIAENRVEVGIAYKDSVFTDNLDINGSVTDASHNITLTVDPGNRHIGIAGTGVVVDPAANGNAITVQDDDTVVQWLEVLGWSGTSSEAVRINADRTLYENMLVHDGPDTDSDGFYIQPSSGNWTATVRNSIIYNVSRAGIHLQNHTGSPSNIVFNLENITVYNCGIGASPNAGLHGGVSACTDVGGATVNAKNVLAVGNVDADGEGDGDFNTGNLPIAMNCNTPPSWGTSDSNFSSDTTAPGATFFHSQPVGQFVSTVSGSEDLHLKTGAQAIDQGTALTRATDIDFQTRPQGPGWDIGADEHVAGSCPSANAPWYDTEWNYRKAVTINSGMVSAPLIDFPVLVRRTTETDLAARAQNDGDDILFTAADGVTKLSHEIERFDGVSGELVAWVKVPYVSSGADTGIYLYYGNLAAGNQEDVANVWTASFRAVWHLVESPTGALGELADSTGTNDGTTFGMDATDQVPGKIGGSLDFDGTDDYGDVAHDPSIDFGDEDFSYVAWVKGPVSGENRFLMKGTSVGGCGLGKRYALRSNTASLMLRFVLDDDLAKTEVARPSASYLDNTWHHVAFTRDAATDEVRVYLDGMQDGVTEADVAGDISNPCPLYIARDDTGTQFAPVNLDEVRIIGATLSPEWIEAEFNNQDDPVNFCQLCAQVTEVSLESFEARALDRAVELHWKTASELNNLGFHLYRSMQADGPYQRITSRLIPGLGSSPAGAAYRYRDEDVTNGGTYYYELEDVETMGATTRHGPVWASPRSGLGSEPEAPGEDGDTDARLAYGNPEASGFRIVPTSGGVVLELATGGFEAVVQADGTVRLEVPGLEEPAGLSVPVKRAWVDAIAGRDVKVVSIRTSEVERFDSLSPSAELQPELVASANGTVRARLRRSGRRVKRLEAAKLLEVAYQGASKKALFELSPFAWDGSGLLLAKKLEVRVSFRGREARRRSPRRSERAALRLATSKRGLYAVNLDELLGRRSKTLRLSHQGADVATHIQDGVLYFWSEGAAENPYGMEAVYELELGVQGGAMAISGAGTDIGYYRETVEREENRYYQAGLVNAADLWLWDLLLAPERKTFTFQVTDLYPENARLEVWLEGTSDLPGVEDHHLRVYVNGSFVADGRWDGKSAHKVDAELIAGVLREGENVLELESVDDGGAAYSMVMLDRFRVRYPRSTAALERARYVVDVTETPAGWVASRSGFDAQRTYVAVDAPLRPEVRAVEATSLRTHRGVDYLVIGPRELVDAAQPLLRHRQGQGLIVATASTEAVASEFGHGELTPSSIHDFIAYAYHEWPGRPLRYVLLLGDATYDYKDYLGTGVRNQLPPYMVRTSYLWTASDPAYAAVHGDDLLPDLAIGRLPAKTTAELAAMVGKILDFEDGDRSAEAPFVLLADDADAAGDFRSDAEEIASTLLADRKTTRVYLDELGSSQTRDAIQRAFDAGALTMSYLGHGGIHVWADENVFDAASVGALSSQAQQPLLLTMNCLNGYYHFPYFDSLAEELLKPRDKGVIAAFSPSGLSLNGPAHRYHKALLRALVSGEHRRLGDAILAAQKAYADTGAFPELLAIYHLLGDPALIFP